MQGETRKLATIRVVDEVLPIANADAIELVRCCMSFIFNNGDWWIFY